MKTCRKCGIEKSKTLFESVRLVCKVCRADYKKEFYRQNTYKYKGIYLNSRYKNMSYTRYLEILNKQNGNCCICNKHESELGKSLVVDHCHESEEVRGLLCGNCNTALGLLKESEELMLNVIKYLEISRKPLTTQSQSDTVNTQE